MEHIMKLTSSPFERTNSGKKTIEGRLLDEKRKQFNIGDVILFKEIGSDKRVRVEITDLRKYKTFSKMYDETNLKDWAWEGSKEEFVNGFYEMYSKEDEKKYGTLAIYFRLLL